MRFNTFVLLNAFALIAGRKEAEPVTEPVHHSNNPEHERTKAPEKTHPYKESTHASADGPTTEVSTTQGRKVPDWTQYTQGDRADWTKYMNKPEDDGQGADGQFDWMKFAGPYMSQYTQQGNNTDARAPSNATGNGTWNNGQGDGFGEPFRSQTGGDFRYKSGREWNQSEGSWQQFAAPYSAVNPQAAGSQGNQGSQGGNMDWQKYVGGSGGDSGSSQGSMDWQKYAGGGSGGSQGNMDWQKYMGGSEAGNGNKATEAQQPPQSGGYFELEASGKDLNVTTNFGLGQGHGGNATNNGSGGGGGGGGNQNSITAKEGRIFIRGQFLNQLMGKDVVLA
jgi:hypothetical protein